MPTVSEISSRYIDEVAQQDPVRAERWGVASDPTRLTDYSPAGFEALRELLGRTLDALADAEPPSDEAERLGAGFLTDWIAGEAGVIDAGERERGLSIIVGPAASTRSVFDLMDHSNAEDWARIAARLRAVPGCMNGYRASLQAGLDHGRPAARRQAIAVAEQCTTWAGKGNGDGGWFGGFVKGAAAAGADEGLQAELASAARGAAESYGSLAAWLRDEYAPKASETDASGDERYQAWARFLLGTDLDLDEAYAWGWGELARLEAEKATECAKILPGASFLEVRELLITDPARSVEGVDAYRDWLQSVTNEAIEGLDGVEFDIHPSIRRCDVRIPPEGSAAAAYYTHPSEDLKRPGQAWFPTFGRTRFPMWDEVQHRLPRSRAGSSPPGRHDPPPAAHPRPEAEFRLGPWRGLGALRGATHGRAGLVPDPRHAPRLPVRPRLPGGPRRRRHRATHRACDPGRRCRALPRLGR
jgi:uncharacterized protein (DUF885 family)